MPRLGTAYVVIKADRSTLASGLSKARKSVGDSVDRMQRKVESLTFNAVVVAAAAMSAAIVYNMKKSIDAASDLQEVQGKFDVVFKNQKALAES